MRPSLVGVDVRPIKAVIWLGRLGRTPRTVRLRVAEGRRIVCELWSLVDLYAGVVLLLSVTAAWPSIGMPTMSGRCANLDTN